MNLAPRMSKMKSAASLATLARAKEMEADGRTIVHLEVGEPDFPTPPHIVDAGARALKEGHTTYTAAAGYQPLRQAIAEHASDRLGLEVGTDEVMVTPGGKPIIFYSIMALVGPGDEAVIPDPTFPVYESVIGYAGGTPVRIPLREAGGFALDLDALADALSDRTRLLVLNSPANPTGGVMSADDVAAVARLLADYPDVAVLSDEIYSRIIYDGAHHTIASQPGMRDRTIILDGFSKTYAMTGWRLGWGIVPRRMMDAFTRQQINVTSCANAATQVAGITALTGPQDCVHEMVAAFRERRDMLVAGLNDLPGITCTTPGGAFYAFPNISGTGRDAESLAESLLIDGGVALLPGTGFGPGGSDYLRISYAASTTDLARALEGIEKALRTAN